MSITTKLAAILLVGVTAAIGCASRPFITDANGATFQQWRFRHNVICVETPASVAAWPVLTASRAWSKNGLVRVTAGPSCAAYPKEQRILVKTYSSTEYACAKTQSGLMYSGGITSSMTIWVNVHPQWASRCRANAAMRAHVITHELGHALGLGHPDAEVYSVMQDWDVQWPTERDLTQLRVRYQ